MSASQPRNSLTWSSCTVLSLGGILIIRLSKQRFHEFDKEGQWGGRSSSGGFQPVFQRISSQCWIYNVHTLSTQKYKFLPFGKCFHNFQELCFKTRKRTIAILPLNGALFIIGATTSVTLQLRGGREGEIQNSKIAPETSPWWLSQTMCNSACIYH